MKFCNVFLYYFADELKKKILDSNPVNIVDVRTNEETEMGVIPGAKTIPMDEIPDNLKEFIEWCSKNQVPANKFEIKRIKDDEYGLFATSNHNENDVLFEISRKVFMTNETAAADIKLSMFVLKIIDLDWNNNFIL